MNFLDKLKTSFSGQESSGREEELLNEGDQEYVELDTSSTEGHRKVIVRPFTIEDFSDIKAVLDSLREGNTIGLLNIRPLKEKDLIELKRAINKLKKTAEAVDGDIAGFGDDYIIVTPSYAHVHRAKGQESMAEIEAEN